MTKIEKLTNSTSLTQIADGQDIPVKSDTLASAFPDLSESRRKSPEPFAIGRYAIIFIRTLIDVLLLT